MQPAEDFPSDDEVVLRATHLSATSAPIRLAPAPVAALRAVPPSLPSCTPWGSHDGTTHGYVQRQPWGVTLMATSGVSGCRSTASLTLQSDAARELGRVMLGVFDAALKDASECRDVQWGGAASVHGRVTLTRKGIDVTATAVDGSEFGASVTGTVRFRGIDAVYQIGILLFGQADAHDAEFGCGEGDAA